MVGVDDQEIDRADETACADRGSKSQDGPAHDDALRLGDEDARLRKVHQLAHEVRGIERARVAPDTKISVAHRDETIDIGDTGCSDQVFHAEGSYLAGRRTVAHRLGPFWPPAGTVRPADPADGEREARDTREAHGGGAADRYCIRFAGGYDTASFRRSPARRPNTVLHRCPSRTACLPDRRPGRAPSIGGEHEGRRTSGASPGRAKAGKAPDRRSLRIRRTIEHQEENA